MKSILYSVAGSPPEKCAEAELVRLVDGLSVHVAEDCGMYACVITSTLIHEFPIKWWEGNKMSIKKRENLSFVVNSPISAVRIQGW